MAIIFAIRTIIANSLDNLATICVMDEPKTLRMPISLNLFWVVKADNPNKPKQAIKMANTEK